MIKIECDKCGYTENVNEQWAKNTLISKVKCTLSNCHGHMQTHDASFRRKKFDAPEAPFPVLQRIITPDDNQW